MKEKKGNKCSSLIYIGTSQRYQCQLDYEKKYTREKKEGQWKKEREEGVERRRKGEGGIQHIAHSTACTSIWAVRTPSQLVEMPCQNPSNGRNGHCLHLRNEGERERERERKREREGEKERERERERDKEREREWERERESERESEWERERKREAIVGFDSGRV